MTSGPLLPGAEYVALGIERIGPATHFAEQRIQRQEEFRPAKNHPPRHPKTVSVGDHLDSFELAQHAAESWLGVAVVVVRVRMNALTEERHRADELPAGF